jgi:SAM-dependent methyltransferase
VRDAPDDRPLQRTRRDAASLGAAWEEHAREWVAWAREPHHDSYWLFHRETFLELVPPPARRTLDLGCGEGRVSRDLKRLGHDVVAVDGSPTMIVAARAADPTIEALVADAASLPFEDGEFDTVVAHMSLQDVDDVAAALRESARVLQPGGRLCIAVVHPLNSAGEFEGDEAASPFVIRGSYLDESFYEDDLARAGLEMTFVSAHRPLHTYTEAINGAGLLIDRLREVPVPEQAVTRPRSRRWQRLPLFLHLRALKPAAV